MLIIWRWRNLESSNSKRLKRQVYILMQMCIILLDQLHKLRILLKL